MSMKQRSLAGLKSKKHGDFFENLLMFFAHHSNFTFIKLPSGCKYLPTGKMVAVKSPFDFILTNNEHTLFIDAKMVSRDHFYYSDIDQDQVRCLTKVKNKNNYSGYIIDFNGEVSFVPVEKLREVKPGTGITKDDGVYLGTIKQFDISRIVK